MLDNRTYKLLHEIRIIIITAILVFSFPEYQFASDIFSKDEQISSFNLRKYVTKLGHDSMLGRPTDGLRGNKAAEIIANALKEYGITPGFNNSFYQNVPLHEIKVLPESELRFISNDTFSLSLNDDYLVHSSGMMSYFPRPVETVFAGFGIFAPEYDYNDYLGINVKGKVVIVMSGEPYSEDPAYFNGIFPTRYSGHQYKAKEALARGARACIILVTDYDLRLKPWANMLVDFHPPEMTLAQSATEILTILIPLYKVKSLIAGSGIDVHQDEKGEISFKGSIKNSFYFQFKGKYSDKTLLAPNVIGLIEAKDNNIRDEFLIVSAHYDHLGIGIPLDGDSIYNGVLDNALGVSALLELARVLKLLQSELKRHIIVLFTTAEERGLLGSIYYVRNPIVPLYKTVANINIDGVAFIDNFNSIIGVGSMYSELHDILSYVAESKGLYAEDLPYEVSTIEAFNRSDQTIFAQAGVPSILVLDGTDYVNVSHDYGFYRLFDYFVNIYHTPADELNILINYDASVQYTNFLLNLIIEISNRGKNPEWYRGSPFEMERLRSRAERR